MQRFVLQLHEQIQTQQSSFSRFAVCSKNAAEMADCCRPRAPPTHPRHTLNTREESSDWCMTEEFKMCCLCFADKETDRYVKNQKKLDNTATGGQTLKGPSWDRTSNLVAVSTSAVNTGYSQLKKDL